MNTWPERAQRARFSKWLEGTMGGLAVISIFTALVAFVGNLENPITPLIPVSLFVSFFLLWLITRHLRLKDINSYLEKRNEIEAQ